ncbi:MAG: hypothetical protein QXU18_14270 [Thermoplasmatales archaeon]
MSQEIKNVQAQTDASKELLENVLLYGISAKKYCLYRNVNGENGIIKYFTNGLGHLLNIDGEQTWKYVLRKHFGRFLTTLFLTGIFKILLALTAFLRKECRFISA